MVRKLRSGLGEATKTPPLRLRPARRRRGKAPFTLSEVLVASAVLVMVGATAICALTLTNRQVVNSRVRAVAQSVARTRSTRFSHAVFRAS